MERKDIVYLSKEQSRECSRQCNVEKEVAGCLQDSRGMLATMCVNDKCKEQRKAVEKIIIYIQRRKHSSRILETAYLFAHSKV